MELEEALLEFNRFIYGKQLKKDDLVEIGCCIIAGYKKEKEKNEKFKNKIENKIEYFEIRKAECDDIESKVRLDVKINAYKELLEDK